MSADATTGPLLLAERARITVDDVPAILDLDIVARGDRLLLVGDVEPLLAVMMGTPTGRRSTTGDGETRLSGGVLRVLGADVGAGDHFALCGSAPLDPILPLRWTAVELVRWSARLGGISAMSAGRAADKALERVGLSNARKRRIANLGRAERRALVLAQAVAAPRRVLVAEAPLAGLAAEEVPFVQAALDGAGVDRSVIVSATRMDLASAEGQLARTASEIAVVKGGEVILAGPPDKLFSQRAGSFGGGAGRVYGLHVRSNSTALRAELEAIGVKLAGGPRRFSATLPEGRTPRQIFEAASRVRAAIVELTPLL